MNSRVAAVVSAPIFGVSAPVSSAIALDARLPMTPDATITASVDVYDALGRRSLSEPFRKRGQAGQPNLPVRPYDHTSGGSGCRYEGSPILTSS